MNNAMLLKIEDLELVADGDENELLEAPAGAIAALVPDYDPIDDELTITDLAHGDYRIGLRSALLEGLLKKKFDDLLHPRWPKGTPKAGKFMRKGEVFEADGKKWQITNTVRGHIEAVEASGNPSAVEHRIFDAKVNAVEGVGVGIPGVKPAKLHFENVSAAKSAAKSSADVDVNSPIVVPYVEPDTHDPSIKPHDESPLTAKAWKRFGREDQLYYNETMERFGKWSASEGKSLFKQLYGEYDQSAINNIKQALSNTIGEYSNSGQKVRLNLASLLEGKGWDGEAGYENTKVIFDELVEAIHWDLYNRTQSPDITLFHGGGRSVSEVAQSHLTGKFPIFSGFSQSPHLHKATKWGSTVLATPTAVRHIVLSHFQGLALGDEQEIAVGVRMKLDERSVVFNSSSFGVTDPKAKAALSKFVHGSDHKTVSGEMIEELKAVWAGHGTIPIPEEPPGITPMAVAGSQYEKLPPTVASEAGGLAHTLKYKSEDGSKEAAIGKIDGMGLLPGDFIEGLKGTRYVIISDAGDEPIGLRYVKIDPATSLPDYNKSYHFNASAGNDFYRLDGHVEIPKPKKEAGFAAFTPAQYEALVPDKPKPMFDFTPGEMFKVEGEGYKVIGPSAGTNKVEMESLDTGKRYLVNGLFKGTPLIPSEDFVPPTPTLDWEPFVGQHLVTVGDSGGSHLLTYVGPPLPGAMGEGQDLHRFRTAAGHIMTLALSDVVPADVQPEQNAAVGDSFSHEGKKYVVSSILKSGTLRAKPTGGPVEKFNPPGTFSEELPTATGLLRLGEFSHDVKKTGHDLEVGDLISAGTGNKIRPYVVTGKATSGNKLAVKNLETGEVSAVNRHKSWRTITRPDPNAQKDPAGNAPGNPATKLPPTTPSNKVIAGNLEPGDQFLFAGKKYEAVTLGGVTVKKIQDDGTLGSEITGGAIANNPEEIVTLLKPKPEPGKFDQSKYVEGDKANPQQMEVGDLFLSQTGLPLMLKSKNPKAGATAVALHNGKLIKNLPYDKPYTRLVPKPEAPFDYEQMTPGDTVPLLALKAGDQYKVGEGYATVQIVSTAVEDDHHFIVKSVMPDGSLAPGSGVTNISGYNDVLYVGKAKPPVDVPDVPDGVDVSKLSGAGLVGYQPYGHHKSGTAKHTKVGELSDGTKFTTKDGGVWIKKSTEPAPGAGEVAVITDGEKHFNVDATDWVKAEDQVPAGINLIDNSGPLPGKVNPDAPQKNAVAGDMVATELTLEQLGAKAGDLIGAWDGIYKLDVDQPYKVDGILVATEIDTGKQENFATQFIPEQIKVHHDSLTPGLPPSPAIDLEVGDTFHFNNVAGVHSADGWVVKAVTPASSAAGGNLITAENPSTGNMWSGETAGLSPAGTLADFHPGQSNEAVVYGVSKAGDAPAPAVAAKKVSPNAARSENIPVPHTTGEKIAVSDLPSWGFAETAQGKFIYKGLGGGLFQVATTKQSKLKPTTKVTPIHFEVDTTNLIPGDLKKLGDFKPGDLFEFKGDPHLTVKKTEHGVVQTNLVNGQVFLNPPHLYDHTLTSLVSQPEVGQPSDAKAAKVVLNDIKGGHLLPLELHNAALVAIADHHAEGFANHQMKISKEPSGQWRVVAQSPAGSVVDRPIGKAGKLPPGTEINYKTASGELKTGTIKGVYASSGEYNVTDWESDTPNLAIQPEQIAWVDEMTKPEATPGTYGTASADYPHGTKVDALDWGAGVTTGEFQPAVETGGGPFIGVKFPNVPTQFIDVFDLAKTDDSAKELAFGDLPEGAIFDAHGGRWRKGNSGAVLLKKLSAEQLAPIGYVEKDFASDTKTSGPKPVKGSDLKVGDHYVVANVPTVFMKTSLVQSGPEGQMYGIEVVSGDDTFVDGRVQGWLAGDMEVYPVDPPTPQVVKIDLGNDLSGVAHLKVGDRFEYSSEPYKIVGVGDGNVTVLDYFADPAGVPRTIEWMKAGASDAHFVAGDSVNGDADSADKPTADINFDDLLNAPSWPEGTPPPVKGDKVAYVSYDDGQQHTGEVAMVTQTTDGDTGAPQTTYVIQSNDSGYNELTPMGLEDLVGPAGGDQAQDTHPDATTIFNSLSNGDVVPTKKGLATVTDNQVPGDGIMTDKGEIKWHQIAGPPTGPPDYAPSQLDAYLHHKSGSNKYDQIGTLIAGTEFTDKKKGKYRVVANLATGMVVYEDLTTGKQYVAPKKDRVKVTKVPISESRWVMTTAGSYKLI